MTSTIKIERAPDYLEHYGIKGQKHGVQNGPPYPLDRQTHNRVVNGTDNRHSGGKAVAKKVLKGAAAGAAGTLAASLVTLLAAGPSAATLFLVRGLISNLAVAGVSAIDIEQGESIARNFMNIAIPELDG